MSACLTCSACCDHPEPWSIIDLTLEDIKRVPAEMTVLSWGNIRKMARIGNRCVALVGTVGVDARCSIYESRPQICRDYDATKRVTECNACRAPHGLPPLPTAPVPIPAVSAAAGARAAKVRIRIAGSDSEGAIYEGQVQIVPCVGCGGTSATAPR